MTPRRAGRPIECDWVPRDEHERHDEWREMAPPPPPTLSLPERRIEELFLRQNPPVFHGIEDPHETEIWMRTLEFIFDFLHCTDQERITCVSFQLVGPAAFWWEKQKGIITTVQQKQMTWEQFKLGIYEEYILTNYRRTNEIGLYNMGQDRTSITKYNRPSWDVLGYTQDQVNADEVIVTKFDTSLRHVVEVLCVSLSHGIKMAQTNYGGSSYTEPLSKSLNKKAAMPRKEGATPTTNTNHNARPSTGSIPQV